MQADSRRILLVDFFKFFFFYFIVLNDVASAIFGYMKEWPFERWPVQIVYPIASVFSYSGFLILSLFVFLVGYKYNRINWRHLMVLSVFGLGILSFSEGGLHVTTLLKEWDIYHYLFIAYFFVFALKDRLNSLRQIFIVGMASFSILMIDFDAFRTLPPTVLNNVFFGSCVGDGRGGWYLLPWIFLVPFYYSLGRFFASEVALSKVEIVIWSVFAISGFYNWNAYGLGPTIGSFYCYVFGIHPFYLFSLSSIPFLLIRLEMAGYLKTSGLKAFSFFSDLYICRHFGVAFLMHILWSFFLSFFSGTILKNDLLIFVLMTLSLIPIEVMSRLVVYAINKCKRRLSRN
jgi:hypothetical protein